MTMRLKIGRRTALRMRVLPNIGLPVAGFGIGLTKTAGATEIAVTDPELVALGRLDSAADLLPYFTGSGTAALCTFQAYGRTLVAAADAGAARTTLGLVPGTDVQAYDGDLAALAALTTTGIAVRTSANTWATRTLLGTTGVVTVTNGSGGAGDPVIDIAPGAIDYARMQNVSATARVLGRKTAGSGVVEELTLSELLDLIGSAAQGDILYRGASGWARLAAGTSGYFLKTLGSSSNPTWASIPGGGDLLSTNNLADVASVDTARANLGFPAAAQQLGFRRLNVNGNFSVNQRAVSGTVTLSAGAHGHDGWKGGASGGTYTFSASGLDTTANVSAGTLVQVIPGKEIASGVHVLSWSGTAQARVYQGSPTGSYVSSPIVTSSLTAGTAVSIEWSTGTIGLVQLERGSVVTPFERNPFELFRCWERFRRWNFTSGATIGQLSVYTGGTESYGKLFDLAVKMLGTPTISVSSVGHFAITASSGQFCSSMPLAGSTAEMIGGSVFSSSAHGSAGQCSVLSAASSSAWISASADP